MLVSVQEITKGFLDDIVLQGISLEVNEGDRIGLLGVNGAGKTTLLNIITGFLEPDEGTVVRARGLEIGYLRQNDALEGDLTLEQEARNAFARVYELQKEMEACCRELEKDPDNKMLLTQYDRLTVRFDILDGYHLDAKIDKVLGGLGFGGFDRNTRVSTLSGGEKMRFAIAKMLLRAPDLMILDEPTNHLDFTMLAWLEEYLTTFKGAVLVVSHDRYFLDSIAKDICEIERKRLTRYKGGYSSFIEQKAERRRSALKSYEKQQIEIAHMEEYVRKNLARSSSASSVGSRVKALEKMERLEKPAPEPKNISLRFEYDMEPFSTVLTCENLGVSVGEGESRRTLYDAIQLEVRREQKIALVGLNGVGKSTFLKAIQNMVPHNGLVRWGGNVRLGYFDQELAGLDMESTVLEAVHSQYPTKTELEVRNALGRMLIEGEAVYKKVRELSGANRAKVAFAILLMKRANLLLLDEPTNHLDYRAKEVLESALRQFTGTLIVVSHDRYFLRKVPGVILEMRPEGFIRYEGNYDFYLEKKLEEQQVVIPPEQQPEKKEKVTQGNYRSKAQRAAEAQQRARHSALENEIERLEIAIAAHHEALASPEAASDYERLAELSEALERDTEALDQAMEEWILLNEE